MVARTYAPTPALAAWVEWFWVTRWDLREQLPHTAEMLGDSCEHIVLERDASRVVGVHTQMWRRTLRDTGVIRAVKLRAGASRVWLPGDVVARTDSVTPLVQWFDRAAVLLEREVLSIEDDREGLTVLEQWLVARVRRPVDVRVGRVIQLMELVNTRSDVTTTAQLSAHAGVGVRELQRWFRESVGVSPKWAIRRARLREAALRLEQGTVSVTELAGELGYSDHAHLTRDFKAATGRTPTEFARRVNA